MDVLTNPIVAVISEYVCVSIIIVYFNLTQCDVSENSPTLSMYCELYLSKAELYTEYVLSYISVKLEICF